MALRLTELSFANENASQIDMGLGRIGIKPQRDRKFLGRLIQAVLILQCRAIIHVRSPTGWKVGHNQSEPLELGPSSAHFAKPKCAKGDDKHSYPFYAVQCPTGQETISGNIGGVPGYAERLPGRFLAHFPNETVVIKMQQRRSSHDPREHAFDGVDADV